ncbi:hypothetical protein KKB68_02975, partial [Patescibacteria group bacterium]|nr:hypothetical protein [Patescibacteria group bacterium]
MKKKIFLITIVVTEILLGTLFIYKVSQNKITQNNILGTNIVTGIDKSNTIIGQSEELKYYWKLEPKEWIEKPDWLSYEVTYHINNDGLREINDYSINKPTDTYRIITLGDSFTYGHHVNVEDSWSEQLEVLINNDNNQNCKHKNFEVINLGMAGYDIQYIVQRYKELGQKYDPNLILWFDSSTGFSRYNELMQPLINDCIEDISNFNGYAICYNKAYQQLLKEYSVNELVQFSEYNFDIFFNLDNTDNTIVFYYKNLLKENEKIIEKW